MFEKQSSPGRALSRRRLFLNSAMTLSAIMWMLPVIPLYADLGDFTVFTDKTSYSAVLLQQGRVQTDADWNEETSGAIQQGQTFGIFSFKFDGAAVQPLVGSGIVSGLAVGAAPDGTFHGDQGISLVVEPGLALDAFGREIVYAPFEGHVNADKFRLVVQCPNPPCIFTDNQTELDPHGGVLFLGVIAQPGFEFKQVTIEAVTPRDDSGEPVGIVPEWQVDGIAFSAAPEPSTVALLAVGFCCLAAVRRRPLRRASAHPVRVRPVRDPGRPGVGRKDSRHDPRLDRAPWRRGPQSLGGFGMSKSMSKR